MNTAGEVSNMTELAESLTQQLVAFPSPSRESNAEVSDFVERTLKSSEFETERIEYDDAAGVRKVCIVGKKGSGTGGLAYFGHTDVVPADTWVFREHGPFEPTIKDGRIYGRGSCDMKGSVACMLAAAADVAPGELNAPIYITCTADEEIGYGGARQVAAHSRFYREMVEHDTRSIIGEPTCLEVVYAHKGTYGFRVTSRGVAAHSSTRHGRNANLAMIPFLQVMKEIHDETETDARWHHDEFDPPVVSWNIGINDFTRALNITAPQSVCTVYFRPMPGQQPEQLTQRAREAAERQGLEFELECCNDPLYVDPESTFIREMLELAGKSQPQTVAYGTDGSVFGDLKNRVVLGPGDIAQAHTHDEWISLEQLHQGTDLYRRCIQKWCQV